jgi:hypothetical protein
MTTAFFYNNFATPRAEAIVRKTTDGVWIEYISTAGRPLSERWFKTLTEARMFAAHYDISISKIV